MRHAIPGVLLVVTSLVACGPELSADEARARVIERTGEAPILPCWFSGGDARNLAHERLDERRARYRFASFRVDGEPEGCFRRLQAAGVIASYEGLDFELGPGARFVERDDGSVSVKYDCAEARIARVATPEVDGSSARVRIDFAHVRTEPFFEAMSQAPMGEGCAGSVGPVPSISCVALLEHDGTAWRFVGFDDERHCPRVRE